jgi:hypothetical protein
MSDEFVPYKGPEMDGLIRPRAKNKKKARPFTVNSTHLIAHMAADLWREFDEVKSGKIKMSAAAAKLWADEIIPTTFGKFYGLIPLKERRLFFRILAESKGWQSFDECTAEFENVCRAYEKAKAATDGDPKFKEVWQQYSGSFTDKALRRILKSYPKVYPLRADKRGAPRGRRKKRRSFI